MSILTKVLMGLLIVAVLPLFYLTSAVMKVNNTWRLKVREFDKAVAVEKAQNFDKLHGDLKARVQTYEPGRVSSGNVGIRQLETALETLKLGRGRFWYAQRVNDSVDPATGKFKINMLDANIDDPNNRQPLVGSGLKDKSFVYVFQLRHDGVKASDDRYVGEFVVDGLAPDATDGFVPLRPSMPLDQNQWAALTGGSGQWIVYEHMPIDDHDVYSDLDESGISERVPRSVLEEYLNDKKPPTDAILNNEKLKQFVIEDKDTGAKIFLRPLRDYQQIFRNAASRMAEISDRVLVLKKEKEYADRAMEKTKALIASLDSRKAKLDEEKKLLDAELLVVRNQREKYDAALAEAKQQLAARLSENKRLAEELAGLGRKTAALDGLGDAAARTP
jgi:hypothetical protein